MEPDVALKEARIPHRHLTRKIVSPALRDYVNDKTRYWEDRKLGAGAVVYGNATDRLDDFASMARAMVLMNDVVCYTSLHLLTLAITEDGHPMYDAIAGAKALFIQSAFDASIELPITAYERLQVETFLRSRSDDGMRNYYSMETTIIGASWWSMDFRNDQNNACRSIAV